MPSRRCRDVGYRGVVSVAVGAAALTCSDFALAHTGTGLAGGFALGFKHPFGGGDHLLAMTAVGLWGAILEAPLIYALPIAFPMLMVVGAALGMFGVSIPPVEIGVALSVLVLGCCIAIPFRAPVWMATLIVATFALFHGYAHGKELPSAQDPYGYSAGFVLATGLLHGLGITIGLIARQPHGMAAMRALGAVIAVTGVWFCYTAIQP